MINQFCHQQDDAVSSSATSDEDESPTDVFPTMAEVEQADSGSLDLDQFVKDSADSHRLDEYHGVLLLKLQTQIELSCSLLTPIESIFHLHVY